MSDMSGAPIAGTGVPMGAIWDNLVGTVAGLSQLFLCFLRPVACFAVGLKRCSKPLFADQPCRITFRVAKSDKPVHFREQGFPLRLVRCGSRGAG